MSRIRRRRCAPESLERRLCLSAFVGPVAAPALHWTVQPAALQRQATEDPPPDDPPDPDPDPEPVYPVPNDGSPPSVPLPPIPIGPAGPGASTSGWSSTATVSMSRTSRPAVGIYVATGAMTVEL